MGSHVRKNCFNDQVLIYVDNIKIAGILREEEEVAVKFLNAEGSMTVEEFRKEAETMHKLRHKNLVSLLAISENFGKICIITERMSKGALLDLLREDTGNTISFKDLMQMAIQVVLYPAVRNASISNRYTLYESDCAQRPFRASRLPVSRLLIITKSHHGVAVAHS